MVLSRKKQRYLIFFVVFIILLIIIIVFFCRDISDKNSADEKQSENIVIQPESEQKSEYSSKIEFQFLQQKEITQGYQVRMIIANNRLYISHKKPDRSMAIKTYNTDLEPLGEEIILREDWTPDYKIAFSGNHFYLMDAYNLRKYDLSWNKIKSASYFTQLPSEIAERWEHGVDDMVLSYINGSIYLGTAVGNIPSKSIKGKEKEKKLDLADNLYVQEYDTDLQLKNEMMLKDVGNSPGSSIINQKENFFIVTGDKHWDDSSLVARRYNQNWQFVEQKIISAEPMANEEFPMTTLFDDQIFYVGYHRITGDISQPVFGEPIRSTDLVIKAYDTDWNFLGRLPEKDNTTESNQQGITGWFDLALADNKMYLVFDNPQNKITLKEYLIKK